MIYNVRLREILVHEFQVESADLKSAFLTAMKKAHGKGFKSAPIGRFFELETINTGTRNEFPNGRQRTCRKPREAKARKNRST